MNTSIIAAALTVALAAVPAFAAEPLKPGYKVNDNIRPFFREYRVTGPTVGEGLLLVCSYSQRPVVMVYTREMSPAVIRLIKKLDDVTAAHQKVYLGSYVVLLCDKLDRAKELKAIAEKEKIHHTLLTLVILGTEMKEFQSRFGEAETTVILANRIKVKASYAFRKGELNDKEIDQILADVPKILPKDKE